MQIKLQKFPYIYSHAWNSYAGYRFEPVKSIYTNYFGQFSITWGQVWDKNQWDRFKQWYKAAGHLPKFNSNDLPDRVSLWGDKS